MIRRTLLIGITSLLLILFVYTATSKLLDLHTFAGQMRNQPLPRRLADILTWAIPTTELLAAGLLLFRASRLYGLALSFALMLVFTLYVGLVYLHVFDRVPCSCGGVLKSMSWGTHLVFNAAFTGLAGYGILLERIPSRQGRIKILSRHACPISRHRGKLKT